MKMALSSRGAGLGETSRCIRRPMTVMLKKVSDMSMQTSQLSGQSAESSCVWKTPSMLRPRTESHGNCKTASAQVCTPK